MDASQGSGSAQGPARSPQTAYPATAGGGGVGSERTFLPIAGVRPIGTGLEAKMRFQSFFMLMTVQPFDLASSYGS